MLRALSSGLLAFALFGAPASARANDQAILDAYFATWSTTEAITTLRHLANCTVERHARVAQVFVQEMGTDLELQAQKSELIDSKCIKKYFFRTSTTSISAAIYAPLLAEGLLKQGYQVGALPLISNVAPLDHAALPDVPIDSVHPRYRSLFVVDKAVSQLARDSECVARARPDDVFKLAISDHGSVRENEILVALSNTISACENGKQKLAIPTFAKRGSLTLNLYRLLDTASPRIQQKVGPDA